MKDRYIPKTRLVQGRKFFYDSSSEPVCSLFFDEYISEDKEWCLQVWSDGKMDIFEIEK